MAQYNHSFGVSFNDNDGGVSFFANPKTASDVARHIGIFGKWRTRWIFFKRFWRALTWMEEYSEKYYADQIGKNKRLWVFKACIPE